jgi:hypothetical protein
MKLGLITDIHEYVEYLHTVLDHFFKEQVDQIVAIGDVFQTGERIEETCRLLAGANVIGVWGNHDYALSFDPSKEVRAKYPAAVIEYMTSLRPRLEIDGCLFTHVEPWLNPENPVDLWYYEGPPNDHNMLDRIFNAVPNRLMFAGHFHKWLLARPGEIDGWQGDRPIRLNDGRYFVVISALCEGRYAIFDTETSELIPFDIQYNAAGEIDYDTFRHRRLTKDFTQDK